jgi:uroporphyrinogen decarboxylase
MNAKERLSAAVNGRETDRPVVAPYMGNFSIAASGMSLGTCYVDAGRLAEAQLRAWEMFGQDVIVVQSDNYYMAEAFGAPAAYDKDKLPVLKDRLIKTPGDVASLKPVDPGIHGRMPVYINAVQQVSRKAGDHAAVRGCGTGPCVLAAHLMGIEEMLMWMVETDTGINDHRAELEDLFSIALETLIAFTSLQLEAGASIIQLADSTASLNMLSPEMYRTYVFPYEKQFFTRMKPLAREHNAAMLLHICGDNTKVFEDYVQTGADIIAVDHAADLAEIVKIVNGRACLIGNVDPAGVFLLGTPEETRKEVEHCLRRAYPGRYILGTGCEVSTATPVENMKAFIDAGKNYEASGAAGEGGV